MHACYHVPPLFFLLFEVIKLLAHQATESVQVLQTKIIVVIFFQLYHHPPNNNIIVNAYNYLCVCVCVCVCFLSLCFLAY